MARVSYGSRAGTQTDYLVGTNEFHYSQSTHASLYASLQELADALQKDIASSLHSAVPECTTSELSIRIDALLPLIRPTIGPYANGGEHDLPPEFKQNWTPQDGQVLGTNGASVPQATIDSMLAAGEGQPRQIVQRAASRGIIQAIEQIDGFKYSFNNAWAAKDEDGLRFSYICQDSMQNKDRHANGFTKTQKHLKGDGHERGVRKPTYDCKGSVSVKFSGNRRCVDVYYRHYAIHSTVAERKPAPRPVPRRTRLSQVEGVEDAVEEEIRTTGLGERRVLTARIDRTSSTARPIKRKRDSGSNFAQVPRDPDATLSLAELLSQSAAASAPPPQSQQQLRLNDARSFPPPVDYSLPSWQTPLPIHQQPPRPRPIAASKSTPKSQYPPPYPATFTSPYPPPNSAGSKPPLNPMQSGTKSRDVVSRPLPTPPQQEYFGLPRDHIPQSQGLFSTLKPVAKDNFALQPHFVQYSGHRAKTSCRNCRIAKKKCDEGRPICTSCQRAGKTDCFYDGSPTAAPAHGPVVGSWQGPSPTPQAAPTAAMLPSQPQQMQYPLPEQQQAMMVTPTSMSLAMSGLPMHGLDFAYGTHQQYAQASAGAAQGLGPESPDPWFPKR